MNRKEFITKMGIAAVGLPSVLKSTPMVGQQYTQEQLNDWNWIAGQFKVLKEHIYMNNGTMGITPVPVLNALHTAFDKLATTGRYPTDYDTLKKSLASLLNIDYTTLAITKNVTEGINIACWGNSLKEGDEVLMTTHEHVGGCTAWLYRARTEGVKIATFDLGNTAEETLDNLKAKLTAKTRIIAVPHIPCTIGQVLPVKEICTLARQRGIISIIDGAHPLGMLKVDIQDMGCDYYAGCLHKWLLAPIGMGFIYIRPDRLDQTRIYNIGAYGVDHFDMSAVPPTMDNLVPTSQRYSTGSFSGPLYDASNTSIDWYKSIGVEKIEDRVKSLGLYTQEALRKFRNEIEVITPREDISRGAITAFGFKKHSAQKFISFLAEQKSPFTLRHVHEGRRDLVRISTHYYNQPAHIDRLMDYVVRFIK